MTSQVLAERRLALPVLALLLVLFKIYQRLRCHYGKSTVLQGLLELAKSMLGRGGAKKKEGDLTNMDVRYARAHILPYEWIWGTSWVSPGGKKMTKELLDAVPALRERGHDCVALDVGSGSGGAGFFMATEYGCKVVGVDIARDMVGLSKEYQAEFAPGIKFVRGEDSVGPERVEFLQADFMEASEMLKTKGPFDFVWSRDSFLHIADKASLFEKIYSVLKPGGTLLFTDYCKSGKPLEDMSEGFQHYMTKKGYTLVEPEEGYGKIVRAAGFKNVKANDASGKFLEVLKRELKLIENGKEEFLSKFSNEEYQSLLTGWSNKISWVSAGDMKWCVLMATK
jgi:phosphoethanolamine N-methyltransferase